MKAAICDRCRGMVDPNDAGGGELNIAELDRVDGTRLGPREVIADLCEGCVEALKEWIKTPPMPSG